MSSLLVTYDLNRPGQDYADLHKAIKSNPGWAKLSESSYAISTNLSPSQVYSSLKPYLDKNDTLYVIVLTRPYAGQGSQEVNEWLEKHLQYSLVPA
jgi:hypothetical protein